MRCCCFSTERNSFKTEHAIDVVSRSWRGTEAALCQVMTHDLTVRFLGVRGSIATPGLTAGGNTSCVEVVAGDTRIILDAGTGIRTLGNERMTAKAPRHSTILLSHLHWDHVAGLQFFTPIYVPGHRVEIASGPNGVMSHDAAIRALFKAPFFPVDFDDLAGMVTTRELRPNDSFVIGDITVTMARLNHPDPVYGFRLEHDGQSIVYATDTEHFACVDPTLKKLAAGADILIYDAQYTPEEYPSKVGWATRRGPPVPSSRVPPACRSSCCFITTRRATTPRSPRSRPMPRARCRARSRRVKASCSTQRTPPVGDFRGSRRRPPRHDARASWHAAGDGARGGTLRAARGSRR